MTDRLIDERIVISLCSRTGMHPASLWKVRPTPAGSFTGATNKRRNFRQRAVRNVVRRLHNSKAAKALTDAIRAQSRSESDERDRF